MASPKQSSSGAYRVGAYSLEPSTLWGLHRGGLESRAPRFGSGHALTGIRFGDLQSSVVHSRGLESRATDFRSRGAKTYVQTQTGTLGV